MRLLVFGDVHANLISLEQLFLTERNNFDRFVCHGDIVNYGPWSNECTQFLLCQNNGTLLKGNHEEYFIEGTYPGTNLVAQSFFSFCYPLFEKRLLASLESFPANINVEGFNITHAVEGRYIFKDTDISGLQFADNTIVGHSHQQFHRVINGKNLFNTGSLGQNRSLLNVANYLMIDTVTRTVDLRSFVFDLSKVLSEMKSLRYPQICMDYYLSKKVIT